MFDVVVDSCRACRPFTETGFAHLYYWALEGSAATAAFELRPPPVPEKGVFPSVNYTVVAGRTVRPGTEKPEPGSAEPGSAELESAELGSAELGSAELGTAELGTVKLGTVPLGSVELRSAELGIVMVPAADLSPGRCYSQRLRSAHSAAFFVLPTFAPFAVGFA